MNCKKADSLFMLYAEKRLGPDDARGLALHLMSCGKCRESFAVFDACVEIAEAGEMPETAGIPGTAGGAFEEVPAGFSERVMSAVGRHREARALRGRLLLGGGFIAAGVGLFLALQLGLDSLLVESGFAQGFWGAWASFFDDLRASLGSSEHLGVFTFVFVPLLSLLLFVLHNAETKAEA